MKKNTIQRKTVVFLLYILILIFFVAFNFQDTLVGSWNPQYIYNTNGQSIRDMAFSDSLTGFIITWRPYNNDGKVLITTNSGDNWSVSLSYDTISLKKVQPLNKDTVLICESNSLLKTTNHGLNWSRLFYPGYPFNQINAYYMHSLNYDTIWIAAGTGFGQPQLYLTTNCGINWTLKFQLSSGSQFDRVYFYNKRIGFCCTGSNTYKTTNGGENWLQIMSEPFSKMQFIDSLTGWKCGTAMKKTTDGGYNWTIQTLPSGGQINYSWMLDFCVLNRDTIWGCGGQMYINPFYSRKGLIWKTTNGGTNWGYQLPDTNIVKFLQYYYISFTNKNNGWVYVSDIGPIAGMGGVHTTTGGLDTTIYLNIKEQIINNVSDFVLYQNYPNPFNTITNIKYQISKTEFRSQKLEVRIVVYSILGKEIETLVKRKQAPGIYEVKFNGNNFASGIYFYTLFVNEMIIDTKKLILIK